MRPVSPPAKFLLLWAMVPSIGLTACASASSSPIATASAPAGTSPTNWTAVNASAREICRSGVHKTALENIRIERAVGAPLSAVKSWLLEGNPDIEWAKWSKALATAPMDERVAVCVYSKVDGGSFTAAPGVNTPEPSQSIVAVVNGDGESTPYMFGDTSDMLSATESFAG
jgi:hypothetical protein